MFFSVDFPSTLQRNSRKYRNVSDCLRSEVLTHKFLISRHAIGSKAKPAILYTYAAKKIYILMGKKETARRNFAMPMSMQSCVKHWALKKKNMHTTVFVFSVVNFYVSLFLTLTPILLEGKRKITADLLIIENNVEKNTKYTLSFFFATPQTVGRTGKCFLKWFLFLYFLDRIFQ